MSTYQYICPIDQPVGNFRLIDWLETNFNSDNFDSFKCLVAFAKINPFYKLHQSIQDWVAKGKKCEAVFGVDHKGTSYQALQYALAYFDVVNILHTDYSTFHPKLYIFSGSQCASVYYGSSNFTTGGLETNFEGGVIIDFVFPNDQNEFNKIVMCYRTASTFPSTKILDPSLLQNLNNQGLLLDESKKPNNPRPSSSSNTHTSGSPSLFPSFIAKPPRSIPKNIMTTAAQSAGIVLNSSKSSVTGTTTASTSLTTPSTVIPVLVKGFVIQVIPHYNGEILLSKVAIDQNRPFFGFPFTGLTTPKKPSNPTYPQRVPDPIVNINVYDKNGSLVNSKANYSLNMIYYTKKSELRITITPSILNALNISNITTDYPILVMRISSTAGCDYDLDFYEYGSTTYNNYLNICNQTLPSGGKTVPRKMGWF